MGAGVSCCDVQSTSAHSDPRPCEVGENNISAPICDPPMALDDEYEEDSDDDVVDDLPPPSAYKAGPRGSVSAESSTSATTEVYVPPEYKKSPEIAERIKTKLQGSFLFNSLGNKELTIVVAAMKMTEVDAGVRVINQGEEGECLYIVESGVLDCYKSVQGEEKLVATVGAGDAFGELALLYNCPRAASVQCRDKASLFQLDRMTFNQLVRRGAMKRRERHEGLLKSVSVLQCLNDYETSRIADALKVRTYRKGDYIIHEGDPADAFYLLEEGTVIATKTIDGSVVQVNEYGPSDYFGELALLKNAPRAANIIANSEEVSALSLDARTFTRLLGPLSDILVRQY